jgi:predicted DNA-binding transcriptional regulator YafY
MRTSRRTTHQFSFPLDRDAEPVNLRLRVHKDAIYHFQERPLEGQRTPAPTSAPDWFRVSARMPETTHLVPFLLSMGPWSEVLGPAEVRAATAERARGMYAHYVRNVKR